MGGLISIHVANQSKKAKVWPWNGVVLSGPAIVPDPKVATPFLKKVSGVLSNFLPKLGVMEPIPPEKVVKNRVAQERYHTDPLVSHGWKPARLGRELLTLMENVVDKVASKFEYNYLLVHGEQDTLCLPEGSKLFHALAKKPATREIKLYEGLGHEVLNELVWKDILADITNFFDRHM